MSPEASVVTASSADRSMGVHPDEGLLAEP
jgi:hypothetical protein